MSSHSLYILWDESHLWGLLAWRAALGLKLPFKMVRAGQIAAGLLTVETPGILLVPGGSARNKAEALGRDGMAAIRNFVAQGGHYLGFCGGAGLGLSLKPTETDRPADGKTASAAPPGSLSLCPWTRASFEERMQHFMSGHLQASFPAAASLPGFARDLLPPLPPKGVSPGELIKPDAPDTHDAGEVHSRACSEGQALIPVWWPGRFLPGAGEVAVLAGYEAPGPDFWLADLPIAELPENAFTDWRALYGINFSPTFLSGQPCVVHGRFGQGSYTLSYSHLETPDSPFANAWLAHLLRTLGKLEIACENIPGWNPEQEAREHRRWEDKHLSECLELMDSVMLTGLRNGLLFKRNNWLHGWRTGVPGGPLNNLHSIFLSMAALPPTQDSLELWNNRKEETLGLMRRFHQDATGYLLAERLAMTLNKTMPEAISATHLRARRQELFGPPMHAGGLYGKLMDFSQELIFRQF